MSGRSEAYVYATGRPVTMATRGMVATPHYLASTAGLTALQLGGSAVDACIAANATLSVVLGHMAGLGGDLFAQVWDPSSQHVLAINASGRAGREAHIDLYREKGWDEIQPRGPLAANTVPGVVDGWSQLHDRYGRMGWAELFEPAIHHASEGYPISQRLCDFIGKHADTLKQYDTTAQAFMPDGRPPQAGRLFRQPDLAASLRLVAREGAQGFYRGELAEKIVRGLRKSGGLLTMEDFESHRSDWVEPIRTTYREYEVTELPPNTQGIATLMLLNIIEGYDMADIGEGTADYYHLMTEAVKLAFADRDRWVTDPTTLDIPVGHLLSKQYAKERRRAIDMMQAHPQQEVEAGVREAVGGDTVYLTAVDSDGMACSMIQSVYFEFGSAYMPPDTGILLQNRGSFFKLNPDHPNALAPGKRTFHTIIPAMALRDNKPALCFGTMGGEGQPQTQAAMLTRMVDFGMDPQQAIEAPRWLFGRTWGEESRSLKLEGRIPDAVVHELERRGHDVEMTEDWSQQMGHAQAIWIDHEQGVMKGGADPRGDGAAVGY
ncbi:MAG: gamma-glutamyltransferase [Anaerolineae bacterium]|jgi:gamma-glutamyltranspeptidase